MAEAYELTKLLEELIEDEKVGASRNRRVSQEEIKKLLQEKKRAAPQKDSSRLPLGEALVQEGLITVEQLQGALNVQGEKGGKIGSILVEMGFISVNNLLDFLGRQSGLQGTNLLEINISEDVMSLVPSRIIFRHRVLPIKAEGRSISLAMENPNDFTPIHEIEFLTGKRVVPVVVPSYQMNLALKTIEEKGGGTFSGSEVQLTSKAAMSIQNLLEYQVSVKGSDMLLTAGVPPSVKVSRSLTRTDFPPLSPDQCVAYAKALMTERQWEDFLKHKELDFAIQDEKAGRFRVNAYRQKNTVSLAIRRIADTVPSLEAIGLPAWLAELALKPQGLILFTAPTGHGKTTSVAAMIDVINRNRRCNIISLEDPIEYVFKPLRSNINQREIGTDTDSFTEGLRRIFRQAPDVIVVGELRDHETFEIALRAASTGHLVLSTMHASNSTAAIDSMVNRFPHHLQPQVRQQLSDALLLIFSQRLIPRRSGGGLALAYEKLISSFRIKNFIRENKVHQIRTQIQTESDDFAPIESSLIRLVKEGLISMENALSFADMPEYILKMAH